MALTYTINDSKGFEVEVFKDGAEKPFLRQSKWPNQTAWASHAEANNWATLYVASMTDKDAPYAPTAPGAEGKAKPTAAELKAVKDAQDALKAARAALRA